jgi:Fic family protein
VDTERLSRSHSLPTLQCSGVIVCLQHCHALTVHSVASMASPANYRIPICSSPRVRAMNTGLELLNKIPLSSRLVRAVHKELLTGVRGQERQPGHFRRTQNWIGAAGCTVDTATFVPPAPGIVVDQFAQLERSLNDDSLPPVITAALAHAQFETIHPFSDGNGRVGRLLITLVLIERQVLSRPLLYLSLFLKQNREVCH